MTKYAEGVDNHNEVRMFREKLPLGREVRSYPAQFQIRSLENQRAEVTGYASTFNTPYEMFDFLGSYMETVRGGAFTKTLSEGADVTFLANHGGLTLARTKALSLRLQEDSAGLLSVATVNTNRTDARDLITAIEDREIDEMSFGFRIVRQEWDEAYENRALVEINLDRGDVSAVNFGANPNTSIMPARSFHNLSSARAHAICTKLRSGDRLTSEQIFLLTRMLDGVTADDVVLDNQVSRATDEDLEYLKLLKSTIQL